MEDNDGCKNPSVRFVTERKVPLQENGCRTEIRMENFVYMYSLYPADRGKNDLWYLSGTEIDKRGATANL